MVCIFCESDFHKSKSCYVYATDDARRQHPNSNRFCVSCSTVSKSPHLRHVKKCKSNENCYGWFSTEHHKIFCLERFKGFRLFLPKIDQNLMQRFVEMFEIDEKYSFILSSPKNCAANFVSLNHVKIMDCFNIDALKQCVASEDVLIVTDEMEIPGTNNLERDKKILEFLNTKTLICLSKFLRLDCTKLPGDTILQLLSHHTKEFCLYDSHSTSKISFLDIIKKAPNLGKISILWTTTIRFEKTWIQDLLKYKNSKTNFLLLRINLDVVELDVEAMNDFIKKNYTKYAKIEIRFEKDLNKNFANIKRFDAIIKKLEEYFGCSYDGEDKEKKCRLKIGYDQSNEFKYFSLEKEEIILQAEQKERIMPKRSATKRKYLETME